jgi:hypothetical protein
VRPKDEILEEAHRVDALDVTGVLIVELLTDVRDQLAKHNSLATNRAGEEAS